MCKLKWMDTDGLKGREPSWRTLVTLENSHQWGKVCWVTDSERDKACKITILKLQISLWLTLASSLRSCSAGWPGSPLCQALVWSRGGLGSESCPLQAYMSAAMFQRRASPRKGWGQKESPGKERHGVGLCCMNQFRLNWPKWTNDVDVISKQRCCRQC